MSERAIIGRVSVDTDIQQAWEAWTTKEGVKSFFAPDCRIDLRPGGAYEIYFSPSSPAGLRGGEGGMILAVQPRSMLAFTWTAPPSIPEIRGQFTHVVVRFSTAHEGTQVSLYHDGWGTGPGWDRTFAYFEATWNKIVLPMLVHRFKFGPVDWTNPPDLRES
mgnify:CR=1 FL=1